MSRIVAGSRRGHRLTMPAHRRTRPTADRVREAAFSLIADWAGTAGEPADSMLDRFSFLDLYGGSGAVACEAASRGAAPVVCVERDRATAEIARRNAEQADLEVEVAVRSVEQHLGGEPRAFDVVWLDPPYDVPNAAVEGVLATLAERGWLAADGLVVLERPTRAPAPQWPDLLTYTRTRRYGETTLYLASKEPL